MLRRLQIAGMWVFGALAALSLLTCLGSFIWMIWAGQAAKPGHQFDATETPLAVVWTSIVSMWIFSLMWAGCYVSR